MGFRIHAVILEIFVVFHLLLKINYILFYYSLPIFVIVTATWHKIMCPNVSCSYSSMNSLRGKTVYIIHPQIITSIYGLVLNRNSAKLIRLLLVMVNLGIHEIDLFFIFYFFLSSLLCADIYCSL